MRGVATGENSKPALALSHPDLPETGGVSDAPGFLDIFLVQPATIIGGINERSGD